MMYADLIDQDDFRDRLVALGIAMPLGTTPEQACQQALCGLSPERVTALRHLVEELLSGRVTLLPSVREAIARQLLPALAQHH
ncbi:hypothetical protein ACFQDN_04410 [Pseudomonas asuensis]|jgi:hypothetical protein|nr:hypothetical protein [Pseudomonas asuensis]